MGEKLIWKIKVICELLKKNGFYAELYNSQFNKV